MVVVKLMGGMGNQLFQYATGRCLAIKKGTSLSLDLSWFPLQSLRSFELKHFALAAGRVPERIRRCFEPQTRVGKILQKLFRAGPRTLAYRKVLESHFHFDASGFDAPGHILLEGYWQSEKYFATARDTLLQDLEVKSPLSEKTREVALRMRDCHSIAIHFRRADYVTDPKTASFHNCVSLGYYEQAIDLMIQRIPGGVFFVFSDDIPWVREHFPKHVSNVCFVDFNGKNDGYQDLYLMKRCQHQILANSSFSWWGAWLNQNPEKVVVTPNRWFADSRLDTRDLFPSDWFRV
jgi:hypothetical protein